LRGIAIFTMVAANLSAPLLHPDDKTLPFRLYGTFAAPLFILLAGHNGGDNPGPAHRFWTLFTARFADYCLRLSSGYRNMADIPFTRL